MNTPDPVLSGFMRKYNAQRANDRGILCWTCGLVILPRDERVSITVPDGRSQFVHRTCAPDDPDRFCDHGTPTGSPCGRCAALGEMTASHCLFATSAELGVPPVAPGDADLSRIRATYPESMEEYNRLHAEMELARAERKARYDRINGTVGLAGLGGAL